MTRIVWEISSVIIRSYLILVNSNVGYYNKARMITCLIRVRIRMSVPMYRPRWKSYAAMVCVEVSWTIPYFISIYITCLWGEDKGHAGSIEIDSLGGKWLLVTKEKDEIKIECPV